LGRGVRDLFKFKKKFHQVVEVEAMREDVHLQGWEEGGRETKETLK
jgi:hypothetical protein